MSLSNLVTLQVSVNLNRCTSWPTYFWKISISVLNFCLQVQMHISSRSILPGGFTKMESGYRVSGSPKSRVCLRHRARSPYSSTSFKTSHSGDHRNQLCDGTGWGHSQSFHMYCCIDRTVLMECFSPSHWLFRYCLFKMYIWNGIL